MRVGGASGRLRLLTLLANVAACAGQAAPSPSITLATGASAGGAIEVTGLPPDTLQSLKRTALSQEEWTAILRVSVRPSGDQPPAGPQPAILGTYSLQEDGIRFVPAFPFDPGRQYDVIFDPVAISGSRAGKATRVTAIVSRPADRVEPSTVVTQIYPSADVLPENQLRLYVHFSAPMGFRGGVDQVAIVDEAGREVVDPFLPLDTEFWNADRTRYTLFLDPGRVKRGILPNQQMGRALEPGRRYTLIVRESWRDARGLPLKSAFTREFRVGPAIERPLSMNAWKIEVPAGGTRHPLAVTFPDPLDHGLLLRAMGVARGGSMLDGETGVERGETRWTFTPREPWTPGGYELVALSFLEDLAGNRIGRAFEVDEFSRTDRGGEPSRFTRPFAVSLRSNAQDPAAASTEQRAVAFLSLEVPRWRREHACYSCHNNGDAVRALVAASSRGHDVRAAIDDSLRWLSTPSRWDSNAGGEGGGDDKRLARIQFATAVVKAADASLVPADAVAKAAAIIAADQHADGGWRLDSSDSLGSPATYGTALATAFARRVLVHTKSAEYTRAIERADGWLRTVKPANTPDASAILFGVNTATDEPARTLRASALEYLKAGQGRDGGWGPYSTVAAEPFDTAVAILALHELDGNAQPVFTRAELKRAIERGRAYLARQQERDGSWVETTRPSGQESYAQRISTSAWALLALFETRGIIPP